MIIYLKNWKIPEISVEDSESESEKMFFNSDFNSDSGFLNKKYNTLNKKLLFFCFLNVFLSDNTLNIYNNFSSILFL